MSKSPDLSREIRTVLAEYAPQALKKLKAQLMLQERGEVSEAGLGYAICDGLPGVESEELLEIGPERSLGFAFNLDEQKTGIILLDDAEKINSGDRVRRTGRIMDVAVGSELLGRVVDPSGRPLDGKGSLRTGRRLPVEREAANVLDRDPVEVPLQTGIKVVDSLFPIGRGQRELIVGDRQTGKTAIAVDAIINQRNFDVLCVYCAIGLRSSAVAKTIKALRNHGAMEYTVVVSSTGEDPAGRRYAAPYAATSIAEHFMELGRDVLIVYDDLTRHARAYRELSLLLKRPPGREAYPGDIFYIHARLLERSTHLAAEYGGGSLTALPVIETHGQNVSAYIPTNLISITDGQLYLSPKLMQQGQLPAVDVGRSVSRVGGKAQLSAYREVASDLKLAYSQFEELERFSRYGARLEEGQQRRLAHGKRVRQALRQQEYQPVQAFKQIAVLLAVSEGLLDDIPEHKVDSISRAIAESVSELDEISERIQNDEVLTEKDRQQLLDTARDEINYTTGDV